MKFQYIGDEYGEGPASMTCLGFYFELDGEFVDVPDSDTAAKMKGIATLLKKGDTRPDVKRHGEATEKDLMLRFLGHMDAADEIKVQLEKMGVLGDEKQAKGKKRKAKEVTKETVEDKIKFPGD